MAVSVEDGRYPVYRVDVRWIKRAERNPRWHPAAWWPSDPGEGRIWDTTSFNRMYREDPGADAVRREAVEKWWPEYAKKQEAEGEPIIVVEREPDEAWVCEWFSHRTFDVGQANEEALASFERYVRRYEHMQDYHPGEMPEGYVCLMGAEDRWRWHGANDTPAPCRCEHCKAQGVIRINH